MENRDKVIKFLARFVAEVLQKGIVEGRRPKIVWEDTSVEVKWDGEETDSRPQARVE